MRDPSPRIVLVSGTSDDAVPSGAPAYPPAFVLGKFAVDSFGADKVRPTYSKASLTNGVEVLAEFVTSAGALVADGQATAQLYTSTDNGSTWAKAGDAQVVKSGLVSTLHFPRLTANTVGQLRLTSVTGTSVAARRLSVGRGVVADTLADRAGDTTAVATKMTTIAAPRTSTASDVQANFGGDAAGNDPTAVTGLSLTQPDLPRNVVATFGATWGATNDVKVYGTDIDDAVVTEVLAANPGGSRTGAKAFKTITKVTKVLTDGADAANTCSLGTGKVFGYSVAAGVVVVGTSATGHLLGTGFDPITIDATNKTFAVTTAPNGARTWNVFANFTHAHAPS